MTAPTEGPIEVMGTRFVALERLREELTPERWAAFWQALHSRRSAPELADWAYRAGGKVGTTTIKVYRRAIARQNGV